MQASKEYGWKAAGFFDASLWEKARKEGATSIKRLINSGLSNTSVTCVLIGTGTFLRPWVRYELVSSFKRGNSIFGVHMNSIKCKNGYTKLMGANHLDLPGGNFFFYRINGNVVWYESWLLYSGVDGTAWFRNLGKCPKNYLGLMHLNFLTYSRHMIGHLTMAIKTSQNGLAK